MSDDNPYEPPTGISFQESDPHHRQDRQSSTDHDEKIIQYAQLGLRLLGVMFLVSGVGGIIGSLTYAAFQSSSLQQAGYEYLPDAYSFGWFASSAALLVAGIYFVIGGRWVLEKIFLPSSRTSDIDNTDVDSSDE